MHTRRDFLKNSFWSLVSFSLIGAGVSNKKLILVDRDNEKGQTIYLIEGDSKNLFKEIVRKDLVSTGLDKWGGTALGYYHVRKKERKRKRIFVDPTNGKIEEWHMEYCHWYTPINYPEGINGIHKAPLNNKYGVPSSHGCIRVREESIKFLYDWSEIKTPVVIIGDKNKTTYDKNRFDVKDCESFRHLIKKIKSGVNYLEKLISFEEKIVGSCMNFNKAELGHAFRDAIFSMD